MSFVVVVASGVCVCTVVVVGAGGAIFAALGPIVARAVAIFWYSYCPICIKSLDNISESRAVSCCVAGDSPYCIVLMVSTSSTDGSSGSI